MIAAFLANWKIGIGFAAGLALLVALGFVVHGIREGGRQDERQVITHQNTEAGNAGEAARLSRADCVARGMLYDFAAGKCVGRP